MPLTKLRLTIVSLIFLQPSFFLSAQDTHYWTDQFGTSAELLGGIVVGSVRDLSSTYYNPGAIALSRDENLILNTSAFQIRVINLANAGATNEDLLALDTRVAPSIFAVRLSDSLADNQWAVSYLTRYQSLFSLTSAYIEPFRELPGDTYSGFGDIQADLFEGWGGLTFARRIKSRLAYGLTLFGVYRGQGRDLTIDTKELDDQQQINAVTIRDKFRYWSTRILLKGGIAWLSNPWRLGVTITTPGVHVYGQGEILYAQSAIVAGYGEELSAYYSPKRSARYVNPFSLAFGAAYEWEDKTLHFSAEWFAGQKAYSLTAPVTFRKQTDGTPVELRYEDEKDAVINFGIGLQSRLRNNFRYFASLISNYSFLPPENPYTITYSSWDIYQLAAGAVFTINRFAVTAGLNLGYGTDSVPLELNLSDGELAPDDAYVNITYTSVKVIFGLAFN
jgi:hypothetical protein